MDVSWPPRRRRTIEESVRITMPKNPITQNTRSGGGFISILMKTVLVLLVLYALGTLVTLRVKIDEARKTVAALSLEADLRQRTLTELTDRASKQPTDEDLLDAAHEAGYILPGERVFEDAVGN